MSSTVCATGMRCLCSTAPRISLGYVSIVNRFYLVVKSMFDLPESDCTSNHEGQRVVPSHEP